MGSARAASHVGRRRRGTSDVPLDLGRPDARCASSACGRRRPGHRAPGTYIPAELGEGIEDALERTGSLYELLRDRAIEIDSADETYRVGAADAAASRLLELGPGAPVFVVERIGFAGRAASSGPSRWWAGTTTRCMCISDDDANLHWRAARDEHAPYPRRGARGAARACACSRRRRTEAYRWDETEYMHPGLPLGVVFPSTAAEVSTIVRLRPRRRCRSCRAAAGTGLSGGAIAIDGGSSWS